MRIYQFATTVHLAWKVNEEGTEALAVTVGGMDVAAPGPSTVIPFSDGPSFHLPDKGEEYVSYSVYG